MVSFIGGELFFDGVPGSKTAVSIKAGNRKTVSVDSLGQRSLKKVKVRIDPL